MRNNEERQTIMEEKQEAFQRHQEMLLQLEMDANFATSPLSMSAAPLNSGALIPVDGNQAAYVPPALVPSSSEPPASGGGDDGVRATERLE